MYDIDYKVEAGLWPAFVIRFERTNQE